MRSRLLLSGGAVTLDEALVGMIIPGDHPHALGRAPRLGGRQGHLTDHDLHDFDATPLQKL